MISRLRYFAREFRPGLWHICDRLENSRAIYDNDGDKELIFEDEDSLLKELDMLNTRPECYLACKHCGAELNFEHERCLICGE